MSASDQVRTEQQLVDTMLQLARATASHRIIVAGSESFDIYLDLLHRGFSRSAMAATCRIPCGQHDTALVVERHSPKNLEALLLRAVPFLKPQAILVLWVGSRQGQGGAKPEQMLERLGFRIEAGTKCDNGFVLSARRGECSQMAIAA